ELHHEHRAVGAGGDTDAYPGHPAVEDVGPVARGVHEVAMVHIDARAIGHVLGHPGCARGDGEVRVRQLALGGNVLGPLLGLGVEIEVVGQLVGTSCPAFVVDQVEGPGPLFGETGAEQNQAQGHDYQSHHAVTATGGGGQAVHAGFLEA